MNLFVAQDWGSAWWRNPHPVGYYKSTAWIPGNFLSEGSLIVRVAISTYYPFIVHLDERDVVAFQVVDSFDGDSARRDYVGLMPGVVIPLLRFTTHFKAKGQKTSATPSRERVPRNRSCSQRVGSCMMRRP